MKIKATFGIGISNARQEDVIEIDDDELLDCETDEDRENLIMGYIEDWSNNFIDIGYEIID